MIPRHTCLLPQTNNNTRGAHTHTTERCCVICYLPVAVAHAGIVHGAGPVPGARVGTATSVSRGHVDGAQQSSRSTERTQHPSRRRSHLLLAFLLAPVKILLLLCRTAVAQQNQPLSVSSLDLLRFGEEGLGCRGRACSGRARGCGCVAIRRHAVMMTENRGFFCSVSMIRASDDRYPSAFFFTCFYWARIFDRFYGYTAGKIPADKSGQSQDFHPRTGSRFVINSKIFAFRPSSFEVLTSCFRLRTIYTASRDLWPARLPLV